MNQTANSSNKHSQARKNGVNRNRNGSVRNINGMVYVDFIYLGERVRESSGLRWSDINARTVREQLDRIHTAIHTSTFRFADVFPSSKRVSYFISKEQIFLGLKMAPAQVKLDEYINEWYERLKHSGRVTERTLLGYKDLCRAYLKPFFGQYSFSDVNIILLDQFYSWARKQKYRNKVISNASLNKCITILKIISKSAIIQYGWGAEYNPFHGYKKLPVEDPYKKVLPFSIDEQIQLINALPDHWKPYFKFAFAGGLRQGEQIAIKPDDIDWDQQVLHIRRALTRGEDGKLIEGNTKNKYSLRSIQLLPVMYEALFEQKAIYDQCKSAEYLFCTKVGKRIRPSNLRRNVWKPVLKKTNLAYRDMRQTRHSFATHALSCGENPLWIARILGHRNTEMIIKVYSKYIENNTGSNLEGNRFNSLYDSKVTISNKQ